MKSERIPIIDEVRGLSIILMVIYHFFYDLVVIFNVHIALFYTDFIYSLVMLFAGTFIFISGASSVFSKNNLKRGAICFVFGIIITIVTMFAVPGQLDLFGILHMLGICMMLFPVIERLTEKVPSKIGLMLFALIFLFLFNVPNGYIGLFGIKVFDIPAVFYSQSFLFPVGLPGIGFSSSDYFPLVPWLFLFVCGSFFGRLAKERCFSESFYRSRVKPLAFVGRHTMIIYLLHQPILFGGLWIIMNTIVN